jgi:pimeloyl-ACP methyl ester carboxylesterase
MLLFLVPTAGLLSGARSYPDIIPATSVRSFAGSTSFIYLAQRYHLEQFRAATRQRSAPTIICCGENDIWYILR